MLQIWIGIGIVLLLVILAGWWFDHSRAREGRGRYEHRGPTRPQVGVHVAGEMVPPPPERRVDHSSALNAEEDEEAAGEPPVSGA